ncbi:MAG: hypothetical protein KatS3mg089_0867 [Patescibacteria group bacterium]|nr:MAG: hypothetical protein KatS3mg089_0867 [Patescibacteria group bacterium]
MIDRIPSDAQIEKIARLLYQRISHEDGRKRYAQIKTVLTFLGMGILIPAAFFAPRAAFLMAKSLEKNNNEWEQWKKFNHGYLRQTLKRLEKQKLIQRKYVNGKQTIIITKDGRKRILTYALEELIIKKPHRWDGKWRVVMYDIPQQQKRLQELLSHILKNLGFLSIQESVYLIPYPCYDEIEFLREYYGVGRYLKYLLVEKIEDDAAYKTYFGLA